MITSSIIGTNIRLQTDKEGTIIDKIRSYAGGGYAVDKYLVVLTDKTVIVAAPEQIKQII